MWQRGKVTHPLSHSWLVSKANLEPMSPDLRPAAVALGLPGTCERYWLFVGLSAFGKCSL